MLQYLSRMTPADRRGDLMFIFWPIPLTLIGLLFIPSMLIFIIGLGVQMFMVMYAIRHYRRAFVK